MGIDARSSASWPAWPPWQHVSILAVFLLVAPTLAVAKEYEILGVDNRGFEFMFFEPGFLHIEPGDRVAFVVHRDDHQPQSVFVPDGAEPWRVAGGKSLTVTFTEEGVYFFDCAYHNVMGMAGVIVVGKPVNLEAARQFYAGYREETFDMNADRLDPIWNPESGLLTKLARPE
jgi:pseudoazurin